MFDPMYADLTNMSNTRKLHLSRVIHKATIEVTEEGTVASAITGQYLFLLHLNDLLSFCARKLISLRREKLFHSNTYSQTLVIEYCTPLSVSDLNILG